MTDSIIVFREMLMTIDDVATEPEHEICQQLEWNIFRKDDTSDRLVLWSRDCPRLNMEFNLSDLNIDTLRDLLNCLRERKHWKHAALLSNHLGVVAVHRDVWGYTSLSCCAWDASTYAIHRVTLISLVNLLIALMEEEQVF
jgi:hypothetical protein